MESSKLLKERNLKITPCRIEVLDYFKVNPSAIGQPQLEKYFKGKFDRVTLYRTLHSFLAADLIHQVPDNFGGVKYALCLHHFHDHHSTHSHHHLHFKCSVCGVTTCLDDVPIQTIMMPSGYKLEELQLLGIGVCKNCNN